MFDAPFVNVGIRGHGPLLQVVAAGGERYGGHGVLLHLEMAPVVAGPVYRTDRYSTGTFYIFKTPR